MSAVTAPGNRTELLAALAGMTERSRVLAGGTDLAIELRQRPDYSPDLLLYLGNVAELRVIESKGARLRIGAAATMQRVACALGNDPRTLALAEAARQMGSPQIRNKATIGGNAANASPAADLLPGLFLLDSRACLLDATGRETRIPMADLYSGAGKTILTPGEILTGFDIDLSVWEGHESHFSKLGYRQHVTVSRVSAAAAVIRDKDGIVERVRFVVGAITPQPLRVAAAEQLIVGKKLDDRLALEVSSLVAEAILSVPRVSPSRAYKVTAVRGVIDDLFRKF